MAPKLKTNKRHTKLRDLVYSLDYSSVYFKIRHSAMPLSTLTLELLIQGTEKINLVFIS